MSLLRISLLFMITTTNHKTISVLYIVSSLGFGTLGLITSLVIRVQLSNSSGSIIVESAANVYNYMITSHGLVMIFYLVMPILFSAGGNLITICSVGSADVAFPRLNNLALGMFCISYVILSLGMTSEFALGTGWTIYPTLSTSLTAFSAISIDVLVLALGLTGLASTMSSYNFITTVVVMASSGVSMNRS